MLLVQSAAKFPGYDPQRCSAAAISTGNCTGSLPIQAAVDQNLTTRALLLRLGSREGVDVLDPMDVLCDRHCRTIRNGVVLYKDSGHLSVEASHALAPAFVTAITAAK